MKKFVLALGALAAVAVGAGLVTAHKMELFKSDEDVYREFEA